MEERFKKIFDEICELMEANRYHTETEIAKDFEFYHNDLYLGGGLGEIKEDPYGDVPKECCFYDFYPVLLRCEANQHYRRYSSLMVFLQSFINSKDWDGDEIVLVHTGY